MKYTKTLLLCASLLFCLACPNSNIATDARNTAAALNGAIVSAQTQNQASCKVNPTQAACSVITKAINGENALITATEAYCSWSQVSPPDNPTTAACVPVASAQAGLQTAINNANLFITELKAVIQ